MRRYKAAYVGTVFLVGLGGIAAAIFYPDHELVFMASGHWMLAALTFPLGLFASTIGFVLIYLGLSTPSEAIAVMTPVFAALGYIQWFRLIPSFYANRQPGEDRR